MSRLTHTKAEVAALPGRVLACLSRDSSSTIPKLSKELGFSLCGVRAVLLDLQQKNTVHAIRARAHTGGGSIHQWCIGPLPVVADPEPRAEDDEADAIYYLPKQRRVSVYTIDTPRDPMIAALFGPAQGRAQP